MDLWMWLDNLTQIVKIRRFVDLSHLFVFSTVILSSFVTQILGNISFRSSHWCDKSNGRKSEEENFPETWKIIVQVAQNRQNPIIIVSSLCGNYPSGAHGYYLGLSGGPLFHKYPSELHYHHPDPSVISTVGMLDTCSIYICGHSEHDSY